MRYASVRSSARVAGFAIALAAGSLQAQGLNYTGTGFVHGFGSRSIIFTSPEPALGGLSVIGKLWQDVNLKDPWAPQLDAYATFDVQTSQLNSYLTARGGRQVMLGHSMGGLMIRDVFRGHPERQGNFAGIITAGTPHQGAVLADSAVKMAEFMADMDYRIQDALDGIPILAAIWGAILGMLLPFVNASWGMLIGFLFATIKVPEVATNNGFTDLLQLPAFHALKTTSPEIARLNTGSFDAGVAKANIVAQMSNTSYMPLRLASTVNNQPDAILIEKFESGRSGFHKCKVAGYVTVVGARLGRKCAWAEKVMGRLDDTYKSYTLGTQTVQRYIGPFLYPVQVPRNIPSDGVVPNERSIYPTQYQGVYSMQPPIVGANHVNMYKIPSGVTTMRNAMLAIGMEVSNPSNSPLEVSIDGPSSVRRYARCGWSASASGGNGGYSYQWTVNGYDGGTGNSTEYTHPGSGAFQVTVTVRDLYNATATASRTVSVSSGAPMCPI